MLYQKLKEELIPVMIAWWNIKTMLQNIANVPVYLYEQLHDRPMLGFMGINKIPDNHKDSVIFKYSCEIERVRQIGRILMSLLVLSLTANCVLWYFLLT